MDHECKTTLTAKKAPILLFRQINIFMRTEMYERMCVRIRLINKPCVYFWFGLWNIASGCSLEQLSMVCDQHFLQLTILICNWT